MTPNSGLPFGHLRGTFPALCIMESEVTPSLSFFKLVSWFEKNKKQAIWGAIILVAIVGIAGLIIWRQAQTEEAASDALSAVTAPQIGARPEPAEAYLKVAAEYPKSGADLRSGHSGQSIARRLFCLGLPPNDQ